VNQLEICCVKEQKAEQLERNFSDNSQIASKSSN